MPHDQIINKIAFSRRTDSWCDEAEARLDKNTTFTEEEKESIRFHIHQQRGLNWFETL